MKKNWPMLSYKKGKATYDTLQLFTQVLGKIKLATLPWANHSWNNTLHITTFGVSTQTIQYHDFNFEIELNLVLHQLKISTSLGEIKQFLLENLSVAQFYMRVFELLSELNINLQIMTTPSEIVNPIPFEEDQAHATYDPVHAGNLHRALLSIQSVFMIFRKDFAGKASPIHFFWGGFDLSLAFFSGNKAPHHPGKIPGLPDWVLQDAFSHELMDFGFLTGTVYIPEPSFYCYIYPEPDLFNAGEILPEQAYYNKEIGQFLLPYSAVRKSESPDELLLKFLQSAFVLGSSLAEWNPELYTSNKV